VNPNPPLAGFLLSVGLQKMHGFSVSVAQNMRGYFIKYLIIIEIIDGILFAQSGCHHQRRLLGIH
jgi:hypothetical protein